MSAPPGEGSFQIPDADAFFESYTAATEKLARGLSNSGPDRLDLTHVELEFPETGTDPETLQMLHDVALAYRGIFKALGGGVT